MENAQPTTPTAATAPVETKATEQPAIIKHKVKVNDQEREVTIDELVKSYQKGMSADERFSQAAAIRKEVDSIVKSAQNGDHSALIKMMGKEAYKKAAEDFLIKELEYQHLPEHEKRRLEVERERDDYKTKLSEFEERQKAARAQALERQAYQEIDAEIGQAIKDCGLKPTPVIVSRMAELMLANLQAKGKRLDAKRALGFVQKQIDNDLSEFLKSVDASTLKQKLPKNLLDALRKADVDEVLSQTPQRNPKKTDALGHSSHKKKQRMSSDDWFKKMNEKFGSN